MNHSHGLASGVLDWVQTHAHGYNRRLRPEGAIQGRNLLREATAEAERWSRPNLRESNMK